MVSALFVRKDSIYHELGVDCWDIERDARLWPGGNPVIAHPPCRAWGQLSHFAKPRPDEKQLAVWAIEQVRKHGGVLEHPRCSKLWKELRLPLGSEIDSFGGFTLSINQSWFGHRAEKKTLLYICGVHPKDIPSYSVTFDLVPCVITQSIRKGEPGFRSRVTQKEREATPIKLAQFLLEICKKVPLHKSSHL